jgi:TP901 family phage tail tape measure protein
MPVRIPVTQTGLEASIEAAAKKAGKSLKINMGPGAKSIEGLSQPLGRITGKADEFTKSMEAANARVLAFGASVGVLSAVQKGFADLVRTTIEVEKSLASINSILGTTNKELNTFKGTIFDVARNTEQSFETVANAALELSRQGLKAEEVTKRLNDSLVLSRLSGLGAAEAVAGLTSAINSFNSTGITSAEVLNKLSAAAVSAAVSEKDLIEGIKRSGSVAIQAGVSFDELVGVITAVQERTARGGAVIGNSFKTIFTRIQSLDKLETMQNLGVEVTDASGQILSATKLIQNLGKTLETLPDAKRLQIAENLVGKFQIAPFLAILEDYNRETSTAIKVTEIAGKATNEAYSRNIALNQTLSAVLNETTINLKELANTLGEIGVTDSLKNVLDFFSGLFGKVNELLDGEGTGSDFAKGIVKGIGSVIAGPGLAIFGAIILKLTADLAKFGIGSLKTFFGLNRAAKEQATLQGQITSTLLGNETIQKQILAIEKSSLSTEQKKAAQTKFFTTALNEQLAVMQRMQSIAARVTPGVMAGTRRGRGAGGFIPNFNAVLGYGSEQSDINRGVGGAPKSAKPVTIPNFNFGGGQKGTMVANTSEYMVPNFAGTGGSAIFNQDMVSSMGLPAGARRVGAAGGYVPNFAKKPVKTNAAGMIIPRKGIGSRRATGTFGGNTYSFPVFGIDGAGEKVREEKDIKRSVERFSIGLATRESKSMTGGRPTAGKINRLANQGAIGGLAGAIFETALSSLLKSKDFDFGETATFDYVGQSAINNIGDISPALKKSGVKFLDAKIGDNSGTRNSMAKKIFSYFGAAATGSSIKGKGINELMKASGKNQKDVLGKLGMTRGKGASGYIPNFASPLENAIGREKAAGLPINQIRINQDPTLRNAGNPMGLAVTNTRDEPTGAIPNFAKGLTLDDIGTKSKPVAGSLNALNKAINEANKQIKKGNQTRAEAEKSLKDFAKTIKTNGATQKKVVSAAKDRLRADKEVASGNRDLLGGIFAVQAGMTLLGGATADATDGFARYTNIVSEGIAAGSTASFALEGLGGALEGAGGKIGKLGGFLKGLSIKVGLLTAAYKIGTDIFDQVTGVTNGAADAMSQVSESAQKAAIRLDMLSPTGQKRVKDDVKRMTDGNFLGKDSAFAMREDELDDIGFFKSFMLSSKSVAFGAREANFEGADLFGKGQLRESLEAGMQTVVAAGGDMNQMMEEIDKIRKDGFISKDEVADTLTFFDQLIDKANKFTKAIQDAEGLGITEEDKEFLTGLDEDQLSAFLKGGKARDGVIKKITEGMSEEEIKGAGLDSQSLRVAETNLRERLFKDDGRNKAVQDKDLHELRMALIKKEADAKKKADDESKKSKQIEARMASSAAKERIRMAVEMAKLNESAVNKAKDDLEFRKINEGISDKELAKEQTKIKILEAQNESRKSNLSKVSELVALTGELTTRTDAVVRLENLIVKSSDDAKISVQEQLDIQTAVNEVLAENTGEKSAQLTMLRNDIGLSEQNLGIAIERLEAERGIALARLEATRVEEVSKVSDDLTRGRASREIINPDVREKERIEERMRRRGRGLQTGFATEKIELSQARDNKLLAEVNARITRRTGFESDLENTQNTIAQALNKLAPMTQVAGGSEKLIREKTEGVLDAKGLDKFIKEELAGDIGNIEGMGDVLRNLQDKMAEERRVREDGIKALQQEAETRIQNTALEKGLPDAGFLLKDRAKALRDSRVVNLLDSQLSTDPTTRFKGGLADRNFKERSDLMMAGDVEGLRLLDESEEFSGQIIDASAQFAQNIGRAMTDAIAKGESLGGLLRSAAADFFNTLSQAFMQKAVNNLVGQGAGEGGGFFGGILKALTLNSGGPVTGGSGARDDVPALLTGGEFVMKKGAVQKYGAGFMGALNQGQIPMMNKGGLFTPGTYGQGAMKGKNNLLDFATQAFTTGAFDSVSGGAGLASVALEPQSAALTMFGRRNSPQFAQEQASKKSAFGLYVQQINKEKQIREQEKQANKSLFGSILSFGLAFGLNSLFSGGGGEAAKKAATGGSIPYAAGVDTVPTMLSGGEFVMNAAATQRIGRGALSSMNSGGGSGDGGAVINKLDELISVSDNQGETVINITVNSDGTSSENGNADEENTNLAGRIRDVVKQVIDDEKRLGGSLRQARA